MNKVFAAGSARALLFQGDTLIGIANTLTDSSIEASISAEEIRAGAGNLLWGKYFHTSNFNVTLTDAMFNLDYIALTLGSNVVSGGMALMEESVNLTASTTQLTLSQPAIAFEGAVVGWYKKPQDEMWSMGSISGNTMTITAGTTGDTYCVKYFYNDPNSKNTTLKAQYVPGILHVVLLVDLFQGGSTFNGDLSGQTKAGLLMIDIPRLQLEGGQNLALTATGAATISLTGSALAIESSVACESDPYYGTIVEQLFNTVWQSEVSMLAVENAEVEVQVSGIKTETLTVYALFNGLTKPKKVNNSDLTFAVSEGEANATVDATGTVTAVAAGNAVISVTLKNTPNVEPAYAYVTVTA